MSDVKEAISKAWDDIHGAEGAEPVAPVKDAPVKAAQPEEVDAPPDWAHEDREAFRSWQPDVRKAFMDKYTNFTKSAEEKYAEQVKAAQEYAPFREIISQRQQLLQQRGIRPDQWFSNLAQLDDYATRDPKGFVRWYVQNTGIDPRELFGQQLANAQAQYNNAQQDGYADPQVVGLQNELAQMRQAFTQMQQGLTAQQQQQKERAEQARLQEIEQFRSAKGADGKPLHPYFDEVVGTAINMLRIGAASDLQSAYDQAVHANPQTRAKVLADIQAQQRREAERAKRDHAAKATRAAVSISTEGPGATGGVRPKRGESIMETVRRAAADLESRRA